MNLVLVFLATCICFLDFTNAVVEPITMIPDGSTFPVENSRVVYMCIAVDLEPNAKAPEAMFEDEFSNNITSTDRVKIERKKFDANATTILTLTFDPIKIDDITLIQCRFKMGGRQVTIHVVPKSSLPNVTLTPSGQISVDKGSQALFVCSVSTVIQGQIKSIDLTWSFKNNKTLPKNAQKANENKTSNSVVSALIINGVTEANAGVYRCSAILIAEGGDQTKPDMFYKDVDLEEVAFNVGGDNSSEEVESTAGDDVTFDCKVLGVPLATIEWFKDDNSIMDGSNKRYQFSKQDETNPGNRKLTVKDATYTDRGVFKCEATRKRDVVIKKFTLRVRDPLGALWPFIGIVVEAIILAVIILSYEFYKKQKKDKTDNVDGTFSDDYKETSPLVSKAPKVSYTAGEDGVRSRPGNEVVA